MGWCHPGKPQLCDPARGAEHSSFDPAETRKIHFPSGLWDYLHTEMYVLAPCGIRASRAALCKTWIIFISWLLALTVWTTFCALKHKTVRICTAHKVLKVVVHQCGEKGHVKFYLLLCWLFIRVIIQWLHF